MLWRELKFLFALWKANLLAAMEYRIAFLSMVLGMMLNNAFYFLFWVIFFDRFKQVRGWVLEDMFLVFGVVASGFGLGIYFFGNVLQLSNVIAKGQLDYYIAFPRPVLLHTLASRSVASGLGDLTYGVISFLMLGDLSLDTIGRFIIGVTLATTIFLSFLILVNSLTFWTGSATMLSAQVVNALITFSIYPITLFDGTAKFFLLTILPAAFLGAVPAEFVRSFTWSTLGQMLLAAFVFLGLSISMFHLGLRRYESGSAIQTQI